MRARLLCLAIGLLLLLGCGFGGGTPTPLPFVTPSGTAVNATLTATLPATAILQPTTPSPTPAPLQTALPLPTATATLAPSAQQITIEAPADGATAGNPLILRGRTTAMPFEAGLLVRVYDARDQLVVEQPILVQGAAGGPTTFAVQLPYGGSPGAGRIEVLDISAKDGSVVARGTRYVTLSGVPGSGYIEVPAPAAKVTLPLRILAHVGQPGQQVNATVTWADGTQFARLVDVLAGADGRGLAITALDWAAEQRPSHPGTQSGTLRIHDLNGQLLASQSVVILHPDDPDVIAVNVYWVVNETLTAERIHIPRTQGIGRASLDALLWGPVPGNPSGFTTAIPTPKEILSYAQRTSTWGDRVQIKGLTINEGVAYADFSGEILANPGGSTRMLLIRDQITQTLLQFSTINQVVITVEGKPDMLEP
ncbi:MAG: GerMN domain-containing protein [Anaerolineae bacterium]|nr:GerMN domain-containing protein [Anaerolineae bacterium]